MSDSSATFCPGCMTEVRHETAECPQCSYKRPSSGWPADPMVGRKIKDKYELTKRIGAGGFGQVYLARQIQGDIDLGNVVLKFLHREMAVHESVRRRFINEARAARKVGSPHVVKVFDLDFDDDGLPFMVMEFLEGKSLQQRLQDDRRLSPHRVFAVGLQAAAALQECHTAGIIHRDLKPDNLLLLSGKVDFVKVIDFGIARVPSDDGRVTHTFIGTPRYMPPEQIMQKEIDSGVDIYAMGVILYECLTGSPPIAANTPMEYLQANLDISPTPLREHCPELPESLERLLGRMMAKKREERPTSMADVELRLRSIGVAQRWVPEETGSHRLPATAPTGYVSDEDGAVPRTGPATPAELALAATQSSEDLELMGASVPAGSSPTPAALPATQMAPVGPPTPASLSPSASASSPTPGLTAPVSASMPESFQRSKPWGVIIGGLALVIATVGGVATWALLSREEGPSKPPVTQRLPPPAPHVDARTADTVVIVKQVVPDAALPKAKKVVVKKRYRVKSRPVMAKPVIKKVAVKKAIPKKDPPKKSKPKDGDWGSVSGGL